jgi:hypothetical protein
MMLYVSHTEKLIGVYRSANGAEASRLWIAFSNAGQIRRKVPNGSVISAFITLLAATFNESKMQTVHSARYCTGRGCTV